MHYFSYQSLRLVVFDDVYEPAEDSFMLARYAEKTTGNILEIGCGTGIVAFTAAQAHPENRVMAVDINDTAVKNTMENAKNNMVKNIVIKKSNLFSGIGKKEKFNYILFNPPYLPTSKEERLPGPLNKAYDGGTDGRKILDRFLDQFDTYLAPAGTVALIHSSVQNLEKTRQKLLKNGHRIRILQECPFLFEKLYLVEIVRSKR